MEKLPLGNAVSDPAWETLYQKHPFNQRTLAETLIGGQAFRWFPDKDAQEWLGIWGQHAIRIRLSPKGPLEVQRLTATPFEKIRSYLAFDQLDELISARPCNADPVLARLRERWGGVSILRQPPGETLLAFICSSNKQILQIRTMVDNLSKAFGEALDGTLFKAMPTWERLAEVDEESLRACALGYRARHVAGTAEFLKNHLGYLDSINHLSLSEARIALMQLPGVGPKVADCVLLFGFGRLEAFPVDTWIAKLMVEHYPDLAGWKRDQIATFARLHFGRAGGLAQQWLFAERNNDSPINYDKFQIIRSC